MTDSLKQSLLALESAAPRYTSFPTAPHFKPHFAESTYADWLQAVPAGDGISLYVHIPFCAKLCYYCGCHTFVANKYDRVRDYLDILLQEIALVTAHIPQDRVVTHLHFGGGSPTMLRPADFTRLMNALKSRFVFSQSAEIAIEADPRQLDEARIATFARHGINRISLGAQDFDQRVMKAVNRPQPFHLSWDAVALCRQYGIKQINLDLMYGLPGQSVDGIASTVKSALTLNPDRIAFFGYAHVPWMKKHMVMMDDIQLPDSSLRYDMFEMGRKILLEAGYLPVGIDHYVRPTDSMARALGNRQLRRNFQGYTTDTARTLVGFGASAIGRFEQGYAQNFADLRQYNDAVMAGHMPVHKGYQLNQIDRECSDIISQIMCYLAVDLHAAAPNDAPLIHEGLERLKPLAAAGLVRIDNDFVRIMHPHAARLAARAFDYTAQNQAARHSRVI